jgi:hypothetical protein
VNVLRVDTAPKYISAEVGRKSGGTFSNDQRKKKKNQFMPLVSLLQQKQIIMAGEEN